MIIGGELMLEKLNAAAMPTMCAHTWLHKPQGYNSAIQLPDSTAQRSLSVSSREPAYTLLPLVNI